MLKKIISILLDFIFPQECLGCQQEKTFLCDNCDKSLTAEKLNSEALHIDKGLIAANYHIKLVANLIKALKYYNLQMLADVLSDLLIQRLKMETPTDFVVIPIPLHQRRLKRRGFNQSELLARRVAKHFNWPLNTNLIRIKNTQAQAKLNKKQRLTNLNGAFEYHGQINQPVLLIDDVMTTGQTLSEAAKKLRQHGATEIWSLVIAKNS